MRNHEKMREDIRFGGTNEDIVWKSPITDFNTGSTVIVNETQGAVFYMNGEVSDDLGPGLHVLETCDTPFVKKALARIKGTKTPFQAELYYVNKVEMADLRWGVGNITYQEDNFVFPIGARGNYHIQVENARKLIEKINGTASGITKADLKERFLNLIASTVGDALINAIYDEAKTILNAPRYRTKIAESVRVDIEHLFEDYGIRLTQFIIEHIHVDESHQNYKKLLDLRETQGGSGQAKILKAQLDASVRTIAGQGEAGFREAQGYTYQQEHQFDVLKTAASNDNSMAGGMAGNFMQMGVGLGAMGAVGGMVRDGLNTSFTGIMEPKKETAKCAKCGASLVDGAKFCLECGTKVETVQRITCPHCGAVVEGGKFCHECGGKLIPEKKTCPNCGNQFENGKFCPECGIKCE